MLLGRSAGVQEYLYWANILLELVLKLAAKEDPKGREDYKQTKKAVRVHVHST